MEVIKLGLFSKKCGHAGSAPWGAVRCSKPAKHEGHHSAKGLRWGSDGKIILGRRKSGR